MIIGGKIINFGVLNKKWRQINDYYYFHDRWGK